VYELQFVGPYASINSVMKGQGGANNAASSSSCGFASRMVTAAPTLNCSFARSSRWQSDKRTTISASAAVNSARLEIAGLWLHPNLIPSALFAQYSAAGTCGKNGIAGLQ
jgi:hypothetical protein